WATRQDAVDLAVAGACAFDDLVREARHGRLPVPADRVEVVADELLDEARLPAAGPIAVLRPEPRAVRREDFVAESDLPVDLAEFELRIGDDDPPLFGALGPRRVDPQRQIPQRSGRLLSDRCDHPVEGDVLVVPALGLVRRREDRLGASVRVAET